MSILTFDCFLSQELSDQTGGDFDNNDVRWVITVPAIWKMPAKQFMREAAYKVGGRESELQFVSSVQTVISLQRVDENNCARASTAAASLSNRDYHTHKHSHLQTAAENRGRGHSLHCRHNEEELPPLS